MRLMQYFIYYYYYYVIYGLSLKRTFKKREKSIMSDATTGYYIYIKSNLKKNINNYKSHDYVPEFLE